MLREMLARTIPYTLVLLKAGPRYSPPGPNRDPDVAATIFQHGKRNMQLRRAGLMPIICPIVDGGDLVGIGIFAATPEEVDRIYAADPAVQAGMLIYEIHGTQSFPGSALPGQAAPVAAGDADKELSRRLYEEVFGRGNFAAADEIMDPHCVSHGPGVPPLVGTDPIKQQGMRLRTAIPDLQVILQDQVAQGDRVASRWTGRGTHSGQLMLPTGAVPATGHEISFDEMRVDRFFNGRIVESWFIPDRMTLWQQFGILPKP
jgi:predicted ester cyclase